MHGDGLIGQAWQSSIQEFRWGVQRHIPSTLLHVRPSTYLPDIQFFHCLILVPSCLSRVRNDSQEASDLLQYARPKSSSWYSSVPLPHPCPATSHCFLETSHREWQQPTRADHIPGNRLRASHTLQQIVPLALRHRTYFPHFTNGETEPEKHSVLAQGYVVQNKRQDGSRNLAARFSCLC